MTSYNSEAALNNRDDLSVYGGNARLLFALETRFRIDDVCAVATDSLTDGSDDKKCDLIYIDRDTGNVVLAQGYESTKSLEERCARQPKSNKASDLNTALAWLLTRELGELPDTIKDAAVELRSALRNGVVNSFQVWYVHNFPESDSVDQELASVEETLGSLLSTHFPSVEITETSVHQIGLNSLEEWYKSLQAPILVDDVFEVNVPSFYEVSGENWNAIVTAVPATWLHELWGRFKTRVLSANVRDYLGSRKSTRNVNHGIKSTAQNSPTNFWVYNNGITALVHDFETGEKVEAGQTTKFIKIRGISIVNGAQTTGAIGSLSEAPAESAMVSTRFVKCSSMDTILHIIQFNNTQNKIEPTDYRSNDAVQTRLREEFKDIPDSNYTGGRRGSSDDLIRRPPFHLPTSRCSQALAAFHGRPALAYHEKSEIWKSDEKYSLFFNDSIHAAHIVFVYSLLNEIQIKKQALKNASSSGVDMSDTDKTQLDFLRKRGSLLLLACALSNCLEIFLDSPITNKLRLSFGNIAPATASDNWKEIVSIGLAFHNQLEPALTQRMRNSDSLKQALQAFKSLILATKTANATLYQDFARKVSRAI